MVKLAGHERRLHVGPARVFDSEEEAFAAVKQRLIRPGDVVVIRYEGPAGGPGMREMLARDRRDRRRGDRRRGRPDHRRPLLGRDPRPHGRATSPPRPPAAGRSRRVREGDTIVLDVDARELRLDLPDDEIARRLADWAPPPPRYTRGVLAKYAALVSSASEGAVTHPG